MSIRIDRAVREAIASNPTGFDLQVTGADDPEAAARAARLSSTSENTAP